MDGHDKSHARDLPVLLLPHNSLLLEETLPMCLRALRIRNRREGSALASTASCHHQGHFRFKNLGYLQVVPAWLQIFGLCPNTVENLGHMLLHMCDGGLTYPIRMHCND